MDGTFATKMNEKGLKNHHISAYKERKKPKQCDKKSHIGIDLLPNEDEKGVVVFMFQILLARLFSARFLSFL